MFRIPHAVHRGPGVDALELVVKHVPPTIAANDSVHFPESHLVEKFVALDAYLANDKLI